MPDPYIEPAGPPRHTSEAGWARVKSVFGSRVPDLTDDDRRKARDLIASLSGTTVPSPNGQSVSTDRERAE